MVSMDYCEDVGFYKRGNTIFSLVVSQSLSKSLHLREEAVPCSDFAISDDGLVCLSER